MTLEPQLVRSRLPWFPAGGRCAASQPSPTHLEAGGVSLEAGWSWLAPQSAEGKSWGLSWSWAGAAGSRSVPCDAQLPPVTFRPLLCECVHSPDSAGHVRPPGPFTQTAWTLVSACGDKLPLDHRWDSVASYCSRSSHQRALRACALRSHRPIRNSISAESTPQRAPTAYLFPGFSSERKRLTLATGARFVSAALF